MSSKPFDATIKDLVELDAVAWVALRNSDTRGWANGRI